MMKIFSIPHTMFAAKHLVNQLNKLSVPAMMVDHIDLNDESIYIIYQVSLVHKFPKNYIVMQTETYMSHWFNKSYFEKLKNALCVWEYNEVNIKYQKYQNKIAVVSPGINLQPKVEKDIPVLFYGWIEGSDRRKNILYDLKKILKEDLVIVDDKMEESMWGILARAKVVINVHYMENQPLELFRIYEALSFECFVISELSPCEFFDDLNVRHSDSIDYTCQVAEIMQTWKFAHDNIEELDNTEEIKEALKLI